MWKSLDGGDDWTQVVTADVDQYVKPGVGPAGWYNALSVDPTNHLHLAAANHAGCSCPWAPSREDGVQASNRGLARNATSKADGVDPDKRVDRRMVVRSTDQRCGRQESGRMKQQGMRSGPEHAWFNVSEAPLIGMTLPSDLTTESLHDALLALKTWLVHKVDAPYGMVVNLNQLPGANAAQRKLVAEFERSYKHVEARFPPARHASRVAPSTVAS